MNLVFIKWKLLFEFCIVENQCGTLILQINDGWYIIIGTLNTIITFRGGSREGIDTLIKLPATFGAVSKSFYSRVTTHSCADLNLLCLEASTTL